MSSVKLFLLVLVIISCASLFKSEEFEDYLDNPYRELRLPPWSTMEDIKKRYNELVKKYHPDKNKDPSAKERFLKIQKAYERLKTIRKFDSPDDITEDDPHWKAFQEAVQMICIVALALLSGYFCIWITFKVYDYCWRFLLWMSVAFILVDKLIPHYFYTMNSQFVFSSIFGLILVYRSKIYNYIRSFFKSGEDKRGVDDVVNDINKKRN